jgi:hypothetical protein
LAPPFSPSCSTGASTRPIGRAGVTPIGSSHIGIGALACSTCVGATAAQAMAGATAAGATAAGAAVMGAAALADVRWSYAVLGRTRARRVRPEPAVGDGDDDQGDAQPGLLASSTSDATVRDASRACLRSAPSCTSKLASWRGGSDPVG